MSVSHKKKFLTANNYREKVLNIKKTSKNYLRPEQQQQQQQNMLYGGPLKKFLLN